MKTSYEISKPVIFSIVLLILGMYFVSKGSYAFYNYRHACRLSELDVSVCENGKYAVGEIDTYVVREIGGTHKYYGNSHVLLDFGKEYHFYTIPVADNQYIQIMASKKATREALKNFVEGQGEPVTFVGVITTPVIEVSLDWYQAIPGFPPDRVIQSYVLKEVNLESSKNQILMGAIILFISLLLYWQCGGIRRTVSKKQGAENAYKLYANSYNKENELTVERDKMRTYMERKKSLKRRCAAGVVFLFLGIYFVCTMYFWELKLPGIFFIWFSYRNIWRGFINSDWEAAVRLAKLLDKRTLHHEMEDCGRRIAALEELIGKEES